MSFGGRPGVEDRAIRVFISSTFSDMEAERDVLVRSVFPKLRDLCEKRGVAFTEIDLRWGLTDQEVAEGKVLARCLKEIEDCRPYFIGLLGERYGWVPSEIPAELRERHEWLYGAAGKSVTELEIQHGVLRDPEMHGRALFYMRDPDYVHSDRYREDAKPDRRSIDLWRESSPEAQKKLADLKGQVEAVVPATRGYSDPRELGEKVLADLTARIDAEFPADGALDPLAAESRQHEYFARSRSHAYVRRPDYFRRLDEFASIDEGGVMTVLGYSGSGKSALLANWALGYRSRHPDDLVLMHFSGSSQKSTELGPLLARLSYELGRSLGIDEAEEQGPAASAASDEAATGPDDQARIFKQRLRAAGASGKVILVLDALNQLSAEEDAQELGWLPSELPQGVRLIVSTLDSPAREELERRGWLEDALEVEPLEADERRELVERYLGRGQAKNLSDSQLDEIVYLPEAESPLYLRILLEELRIWGRHETLGAQIRKLTAAGPLAELLEQVLARFEAEQDQAFPGIRPGLVADSMRLIWASRQGLEESELLDLLGQDGERLPPALWSPLRINASELLVDRDGLLDFAHEFIRKAVKRRYLADAASLDAARRTLADYFRGEPDAGPSARALEERPHQLLRLGAWRELADLLTAPDWFLSLWEHDAFEVRRLWARIQGESEIRAADAYGELGDELLREVSTRFLLSTGSLLRMLASREQALRFLRLAEERARQAGDDDRNIPTSLLGQAMIHRDLGQAERAIELLREAEDIYRRVGDLDGLQRSLGYHANIHLDREEIEDALELCERQAQVCRKLEAPAGPTGLARSLGTRAAIHLQRNELDEALGLRVEQADISRKYGDLDGLAAALGNQATVHRARGESEEAMKLLSEQEAIYENLGHTPGKASVLGNRAAIHLEREELDEAMRLCTDMELIWRELKEPSGIAAALGIRAQIHRGRNELEEALSLLGEQERICREQQLPAGLRASLASQADIRRERGESDEADKVLAELEQVDEGNDERAG